MVGLWDCGVVMAGVVRVKGDGKVVLPSRVLGRLHLSLGSAIDISLSKGGVIVGTRPQRK